MEDEKNKNDFNRYENYQPHLAPIDQPKGGKFTRINTWLKTHHKYVVGGLVILALLVGGATMYLFSTITFEPIADSAIKKADPKFYSALTGLEVSEEDSKRPVTAIMIENSPEARPQSGLSEAGVIFESVAEGGITRFLMLYQESKPGNIGPVRSVRPQFASWAAAFDAGVGHVGGTDIPLQKLRSGQIKDLDQFFNAATYTRVSNRRAPHNVYTTDDKLQALNQKKGYTSSNFQAWQRQSKETPNQTPTATNIAVPVSTGTFAVAYKWDQPTNSYQRSHAGAPHLDREKGQIAPKVVIVLQAKHDVIRESNGYTYPDVVGEGKAWIFQNGVPLEVTWNKTNDKSQLAFVDANGKTPKLNPGQVFITAVRPDKAPTWQ